MNKLAAGVLIIVTGVAAGCQRPSKGLDYTVYLDHMPASILVLPPVNQSAAKEATKDFMESVSRPLAERGYYVFPVAVVESVMVANGATTPLEMRKVPLAKLEELFGADAILYIDILEWAERYVVVDASTTVGLKYRLVDIRTGTTLWRWSSSAEAHSAAISSLDPFTFLLSAAYSLVAAQVKGASNAASDSEAKLARKLNRAVFENDGFGLLPGPRHPEFEADQARRYNAKSKRSILAGGKEVREPYDAASGDSAAPDWQAKREGVTPSPDKWKASSARAAPAAPVPQAAGVTAEFQRTIQRFADANPPYGTNSDRWVRNREAEFDRLLAGMSGCVIGELGGDGSRTIIERLADDVPRAIKTFEASRTPADRLAAARDLTFTLKLLQRQWRAVGPMPVLDGAGRTTLSQPGTVVKLCEPPHRLPSSSYVFERQGEAEVRFTIGLQPGSGNCFLKLVGRTDGRTVTSFLVHDGEMAEVDAPAGRYELRCATGGDWYGRSYLFGPLTSFMKAEELIELSAGTSGAAYVIGPSEDPGTNVATTRITPAEF